MPPDTDTISNRDIWNRLRFDPEWPQALQRWLVANGLDCYRVFLPAPISVVPAAVGRRIRYSAILTGPDGRPYPRGDADPLTEERTTALLVDPPAVLRQPRTAAPEPTPAADATPQPDGSRS